MPWTQPVQADGTRGGWRTGRYRSLVAGAERLHKKAAALGGGGAELALFTSIMSLSLLSTVRKKADIPSFPPPLCRSSAGLT